MKWSVQSVTHMVLNFISMQNALCSVKTPQSFVSKNKSNCSSRGTRELSMLERAVIFLVEAMLRADQSTCDSCFLLSGLSSSLVWWYLQWNPLVPSSWRINGSLEPMTEQNLNDTVEGGTHLATFTIFPIPYLARRQREVLRSTIYPFSYLFICVFALSPLSISRNVLKQNATYIPQKGGFVNANKKCIHCILS